MATVHKAGDSFDYIATIPSTFADGYFVDWIVSCQVRTAKYQDLIADITPTWADPTTTRTLKLLKLSTSTWPIGAAEMDIQFVRISDQYTLSTATVEISVIKDVTRPNPIV